LEGKGARMEKIKNLNGRIGRALIVIVIYLGGAITGPPGLNFWNRPPWASSLVEALAQAFKAAAFYVPVFLLLIVVLFCAWRLVSKEK